jgi:flagellar hook-associated protein FlgK
VQYVGFANNVQVNDAVRNDNSLVQQGTFQPDETIQKGSTEVIDRVIEFGFGDTKVQRAQGQIDLQKVVVSNNVLEGQDLISDPTPSLGPGSAIDIRVDTGNNGLGTPADETLTIDFFSPGSPDVSGNVNTLSELVSEINFQADSAGIATEDFRAGTTEDGRLKIDSSFTTDFQNNGAPPSFFTFLGIPPATQFTNNDLQSRLGLFSENKVKSTVDLSTFNAIQDGTTNDLVSTFTDLDVGTTASDSDRFEITVFDEDGSDSKTLTVDLQAAQTRFPGASSAADQIANEINYQFSNTNWPGGPPTPSSVDLPNFSASVNSNGEIVFDTRGRLDFNATPANQAMGDQNFEDLFGIEAKAFKPEDPYFEIQIGNNDPQKISIAPGDTAQDLVDKINFGGPEGVAGAYAELNDNGQLVIRPGTDDSTGDDRVFGGELKITSGPFQHDPGSATDRALDNDNTPGSDTTPGLNDSVNVVSALFGSFRTDGSGNVTTQTSPINNVKYGSDISASNSNEVGFRKRLLGPDLSVNTEIGSTTSVTRFAERLVNKQSSDFAETDNQLGNEENFKKTLEKQFSNQSGVNIDEEMSRLIVQQNAFSASSRAISTINQMFDELLNTVR